MWWQLLCWQPTAISTNWLSFKYVAWRKTAKILLLRTRLKQYPRLTVCITRKVYYIYCNYPKKHGLITLKKMPMKPLLTYGFSNWKKPTEKFSTSFTQKCLSLQTLSLPKQYRDPCSLNPRPPPFFFSSVCVQYNTRKRKSVKNGEGLVSSITWVMSGGREVLV